MFHFFRSLSLNWVFSTIHRVPVYSSFNMSNRYRMDESKMKLTEIFFFCNDNTSKGNSHHREKYLESDVLLFFYCLHNCWFFFCLLRSKTFLTSLKCFIVLLKFVVYIEKLKKCLLSAIQCSHSHTHTYAKYENEERARFHNAKQQPPQIATTKLWNWSGVSHFQVATSVLCKHGSDGGGWQGIQQDIANDGIDNNSSKVVVFFSFFNLFVYLFLVRRLACCCCRALCVISFVFEIDACECDGRYYNWFWF